MTVATLSSGLPFATSTWRSHACDAACSWALPSAVNWPVFWSKKSPVLAYC
jgi:hypothetical protein